MCSWTQVTSHPKVAFFILYTRKRYIQMSSFIMEFPHIDRTEQTVFVLRDKPYSLSNDVGLNFTQISINFQIFKLTRMSASYIRSSGYINLYMSFWTKSKFPHCSFKYTFLTQTWRPSILDQLLFIFKSFYWY